MAEKLIHELATIVSQSPSDYLVISDGTTTFKMARSQWRYDLIGTTAPDPLGIEGSVRHNQYTASSGVGWNINSTGRGGITWKDGTNWQAILDARDVNRVPYRRILSATTPAYTLIGDDVLYGLEILYAGTAAKTLTIPVMTTAQVPTVGNPATGTIGVGRRIEVIQAGSGVVTLAAGVGLSLFGSITATNGDNSRLVIQYDNTTEARVWRANTA